MRGDDFDRRRPWLIALTTGLFGLSVLMIAFVYLGDRRGAAQPPMVVTAPPAAPAATDEVPVTPSDTTPPARAGTESSTRSRSGDEQPPSPKTPAQQAHELAQHYIARMPAGLPGLPGR